MFSVTRYKEDTTCKEMWTMAHEYRCSKTEWFWCALRIVLGSCRQLKILVLVSDWQKTKMPWVSRTQCVSWTGRSRGPRNPAAFLFLFWSFIVRCVFACVFSVFSVLSKWCILMHCSHVTFLEYYCQKMDFCVLDLEHATQWELTSLLINFILNRVGAFRVLVHFCWVEN